MGKVGAEREAVRHSGAGGLDNVGTEGKAAKQSGGGVRGSDGSHELPSNVG